MNQNTKQIINLTKKLIRFESTHDNFRTRKKIIEFVYQEFAECDVYVREIIYKNVPSLIITLQKTKNPKLFLNGHLDVVPAEKNDFCPGIIGHKLCGRGSGDMKTACAVMIEIMKYFSKVKEKPNIGLILTTDEEVGGENGIGYLLKKAGYRSNCAIIPDGGTGLDTVVMAEKGIMHIRVWARGISAHGSRPFLGDNAVEKLMKIYFQIKKEIPDIKKNQWKNSLNIGKISGGGAINKVPDYAEMFLDIRLANEKERKIVLQKIKKITDNFEVLVNGFYFEQDMKNKYIQDYKKTAEKEMGKKIKFIRETGASDARFFCEKNIPVILTKIDSGNIHGQDEWVDISQIEKFYNILKKFIISL